MQENKSDKLRRLLFSGNTLIMPDAYDPITARIIEYCGFEAVQCSGYSFSVASCYGRESDFSRNEHLDVTAKIVNAVDIPVMADGEDGFGCPDEVAITIKEFIGAGVAGINIEDQIQGTRNAVKIIDAHLMAGKIKAARAAAIAAGNPILVINGRTDALLSEDNRSEALKKAIDRANTYIEAGADLAFVVYVVSLEEVKTLVKEIHGPVSIAAGLAYNMQAFSINQLVECGVARVSLPTVAIMSAIRAVTGTLTHIRKSGEFRELIEAGVLGTPEEFRQILFQGK